jgi:hypothetical protein
MKKIVWILLLLLIVYTSFGAANAVVKEIKGKVQIKLPGKEWENAITGMAIDKGTMISTGFKSQAVLELGKSYITVEALTRMKLEELLEREDVVQTDIYLNFGKVSAEVKKTEDKAQDFKLKSPISTAAVRGTSFVYDMFTLYVQAGIVDFINTLNQKRSIGEDGGSFTIGIDLPGTEKEVNVQIFTVSSSTSDALLPANLGPESTGSLVVDW